MAENAFSYVKPSILDRLSTPRSESYLTGASEPASSEGGGGVKESIYRDSVLRDLEWLFNSVSPLGMEDSEMRRKYPNAAKSVLGYGLRGVLGRIVHEPGDIRKHVMEALTAFEPRLEVEDISLEVSREGQLVEIQIQGFLLTQHARRRLWIRTDLTTLTSKLRTDQNG